MDRLRHSIVLVVRRTRLEDLVARFNTIDQARFHVESLGADFADYQREHETYQAALTETEATLARFGRLQKLDRGFLANFLFPPDCLVVVLGQDGLVANTLKYLDGQPVVGVNPNPARWDGVLLPFKPSDLKLIAPEVLAGGRQSRTVTMARAVLNDGQELHAVNDLFIGPRSHVSARYELRLGEDAEAQSSSGVIISTGLGSTGWFRSLVTGAIGIAGVAEEPLRSLQSGGFPWESDYLYYTVREPFPSKASKASMVFGKVEQDTALKIVSHMLDYGVIFSDGIEKDCLEFNAGMEATIGLAERSGQLVQ